jgi:hypothetical protein
MAVVDLVSCLNKLMEGLQVEWMKNPGMAEVNNLECRGHSFIWLLPTDSFPYNGEKNKEERGYE